MAANSFSGTRAIVAYVDDAAFYEFTRADTWAAVTNVPGSGTTLQLPDDPSDGDEYAFQNPDGSCASGNAISVQVSAAMTAAGLTIRGSSAVVFEAAYAGAEFVYFEKLKSWSMCPCGAYSAP